MKKKKAYKVSKKKPVAATEPMEQYGNGKKLSDAPNIVRIYHSFEEAEEGEIMEVLKQDPVERLKQTINLILRAYGVSRRDLRKRKMSNKIIFGNHE